MDFRSERCTCEVLSEVERNLQDAFAVTRNLLIEPRQLPGGGACEMEVCKMVSDRDGDLQNFANFWQARSRLYQNEILQENMRSTAFFKLYKTCILLHRCDFKILAKIEVFGGGRSLRGGRWCAPARRSATWF